MLRASRVALSALAVASILGGARAAQADPAPLGQGGADVVYLKNGGLVRGTLIDAVPEKAARIQLATGEISTIPWAEVDHVAAAAAGPGKGAAPPGEKASAPQGAAVRLHVEAPRDVEIVGRPDAGYEWAPVCGGACDKAVPAGWEYLVRGEGVKASAPFTLRTEGDRALVRVDPASNGAFILGMIGAIGGAGITPLGLVLTAIGAAGHVTTTDANGVQTTQQVGSGVLPAGVAVLTVGVAGIVVGGIVALSNWSTGVQQGPAAAALALPPPTQRFLDVAREAPRLPAPQVSEVVTLGF